MYSCHHAIIPSTRGRIVGLMGLVDTTFWIFDTTILIFVEKERWRQDYGELVTEDGDPVIDEEEFALIKVALDRK